MILLLAAAASLTSPRDSYPHLSPDGQSLIFQTNRTGRQTLWIAQGDGSNPRLLYDGRSDGTEPATPVWSPDGRSIAFAMRPAGATDDSESDIFVMRSDATDVRRLTRTPGDDSHPHWSADGVRIFFNSARSTPDPKAEWSRQWHDIYSIAADGSGVRKHSDCKSVCTYPVPSPDGRFIAFRKVVDTLGLTWALEPGRRNSEVFVSAIDGSAPINLSNNAAFDGWPMWSPNGRWVVFASNRDKIANVGQIYAVKPDGSGLHRLTEGKLSRVQPSFGADGRQLLMFENVETDDFEIGHIAKVPVSLPD